MTMITINAATVPGILRATRGAAGYSMRAIAELVGVSHGTVSAWEVGTSEPSISQFMRWAEVCGQPPEQLIQGIAA